LSCSLAIAAEHVILPIPQFFLFAVFIPYFSHLINERLAAFSLWLLLITRDQIFNLITHGHLLQSLSVSTTTDTYKKLSCRRETARCFVSLKSFLSHSRSFKVIACGIIRQLGYGFLFAFRSKYSVSLAVSSQ